MASNIIDKVHNVTRQSRENRQFSQDFLSNIMQTYSINLTNSSSVPNHSDPPKSPSILSRSPAPKTPMTKNPYAETISHARESSPAKAFYELKQNFFSIQPARSEKIAPEPEPVPVPEVLDTIEAGSAFNKVDKFLENFHRKRDNLNYLEDKIVDDIKTKQASRKNFALSGSDDIDLEALISKVKNNLSKTDKNGTPQKDISSEISKYSPKSKTFQAKTETSPLVNKSQLSPAQGTRPKNQFEKALMEIDQSPIKPERDENSHVSFRASFDDKEGEDDDFLVFRSKGKPPQPQPQVQQRAESKASDKISGGSKVSLNQSSLPSDSISFNISESGFNTGQDQRKSRLSEKENVSGDTNIINASQEKPPLTSTLAKDKKPEKSESPVKKEVQKEVSKPVEPKNEKMIPKAPIMMQKTVKPVYKEVPQEKRETKQREVVPEKKPQFKNSIKSKIAMLKNIYAGRDANADLPERDTNPNRRSPKQQKRDIYEQESSEEREQKAQERPEILVKDEEEEHKHKDYTENYAVLSPQKEEGSLDDLIYSKLTDEKTGTIDESAIRPRKDSHGHDQNYGDHPLIDMSPMPKRQIDFERASEISFTYSPEDSLIHHHDIGRGRENHTGKKVINPQHMVQKVGKIEWNEQLEREFEAYCDKDPEILKLRSKINYLKGEIALASM